MSLDQHSTMNYSNITNFTTTENKSDEKIYNKLGTIPVYLTIYSLFLLFAIIGNCLVIAIVKVNTTMHNITNYLLVNLAIADLIQALSTIFHVVDFVVKDLRLGDVGCKFQINMFNIPYGTSCLTLTAIAVERYVAVCRPLQFPTLKKQIRYIIPSTWLISGLVYLPTIIYCGERRDKNKNQLSCDCSFLWPSLKAKNIHGVFLVVIFYFLPLISVTVFYTCVIRKLRVTRPGHNTPSQDVQSRRRIIRMLLVTIIVFFVLWTPYNVLFFLKRLEVDFRKVYAFVWYPALLLAFISTTYNPVVYCLMGKQFKDGFKAILCCCRQCHLPNISSLWSTKTTQSSSGEQMENIDMGHIHNIAVDK